MFTLPIRALPTRSELVGGVERHRGALRRVPPRQTDRQSTYVTPDSEAHQIQVYPKGSSVWYKNRSNNLEIN